MSEEDHRNAQEKEASSETSERKERAGRMLASIARAFLNGFVVFLLIVVVLFGLVFFTCGALVRDVK